MKYLAIVPLFVQSLAFGQLTIEAAHDSAVLKYHIGTYSYHEEFIGHKGYGAPLILTADGGGAAFGDGDEGTMLVKMDKTGKITWKKIIVPKGEEVESQSVVQDAAGNFYVCQLVYDHSKYRGGCERMICLSKTGAILWDKYIGSFTLLNNPTIAYMRTLSDGRIALRGQVVTKTPPQDKDPEYHFWEGWLNSKGVLTQKVGEVINWGNEDWKKKFKPE